MKCRETQQMIDRYLKNNLDEKELQAFLGHVRECPSCYEELEIYYTIHSALDYLDEDWKGTMNPSEWLDRELAGRARRLRHYKMFRLFYMTIVAAALVVLLMTAVVQIQFLAERDVRPIWEEPKPWEEQEPLEEGVPDGLESAKNQKSLWNQIETAIQNRAETLEQTEMQKTTELQKTIEIREQPE